MGGVPTLVDEVAALTARVGGRPWDEYFMATAC
jgi:hypothetical protein